ncbi:DUF5693 family protein [Candidatus Leptofilum sp.]|uniref:DUF5693 family protein n=1 Tax=Candidatus Leptofilum sp. TaxID=3241576 RepID=UPI003B5BFBA2
MKLSRLLSLTLAVAGGVASSRVLQRRHQWEAQNNRIAICVDFDDAQAAAIRAGLPLAELVAMLASNGATHLSLPELTLNRLLHTGQLSPQAPAKPRQDAPRIGHWNYLHGSKDLVRYLATELHERLPYTQADCLDGQTLIFAGDLPTIGEIGLGYDMPLARQIQANGLALLPSPVSYAWPEKGLLERTLAQTAVLSPLVAFAGKMILGHEMHLDETVEAMEAHNLSLAYFAESRHQKGDWFVAKRRAPNVILAHQFTPEDMIPLDYHAAGHNWVHFARERGIRLCYVNFFRVLHATAPLEGVEYVHHLKHALEDAGYIVSREIDLPTPVPTPDAQELALAGVSVAGIGATAVSNLLNLPETIALPLTLAAGGGAAALPFVEEQRNQAAIARLAHSHEHDHDHHHHDHDHHHLHSHGHDHDHGHDHGDLAALYPPSYAPKLIALGATALTPIAAQQAAWRDGAADWLVGLVYQATAAAALAASTSGQEYQLRIEAYKGFNLDWLLPLATAVLHLPHNNSKAAALALLGAGWLAARQQNVDVLSAIDPDHAEGHTHHISAAMATVGDIQMAIGPKPARKWAGLGPAATAISLMLANRGKKEAVGGTAVLGAIGQAMGLVGFRHPERALKDTLHQVTPSFAIGTGIGLLALLLGNKSES